MSKAEIFSADTICIKESFKCPKCSLNFNIAEGFILDDCLHIFCMDCVWNHVHLSTGTVIKCLYTEIPGTSSNAGCHGVLQVIT
jgi:hypothetical protein